MLDSEITSSPRRPESPDLANNDANQAPAAGSFGLSQSDVDKAGDFVSTNQLEAMNVNTDKLEVGNASAGQSETGDVNSDQSEVANFKLEAPEPVSAGSEAEPSKKGMALACKQTMCPLGLRQDHELSICRGLFILVKPKWTYYNTRSKSNLNPFKNTDFLRRRKNEPDIFHLSIFSV